MPHDMLRNYSVEASDLLTRWRRGDDVQDALAHQLRHVSAGLNTLQAEVVTLREDKARLDFLEEDMGYHGGGNGGTYTFNTPLDAECGMLRAAIDAKKRLVESVQLKPNARGLSEG